MCVYIYLALLHPFFPFPFLTLPFTHVRDQLLFAVLVFSI